MAEFILSIGIVVFACLVLAAVTAVQLLRIGRPTRVSRPPEPRPRPDRADWRRTISTQWVAVWLADFDGCRLTVKASSAATTAQGVAVPASVTWSVRRGDALLRSGLSTYAGVRHAPPVAVEVAKVAAERCAKASGGTSQ